MLNAVVVFPAPLGPSKPTISPCFYGVDTPQRSELIAATPTTVHAEYYARIVTRTAVRRRLIDAGGEIVRDARDERLTLGVDAERVVGEVADWRGHPPEVIQAMKDGLARLAQSGEAKIDD